MKAKEDRENKNKKLHNNQTTEHGHQLRFEYEDHERVHEMKPLMKAMSGQIWDHYYKSIFNT